VTVGEGHGIEDLLGAGLESARLLLGSMPDVALVIDREGRILYTNQEEPDQDLVGTALFDHDLGAEAEARMRAALHQVFTLGKPISYEVASRGVRDEEAWYVSRWSPIERDGEVVASLIVASDITRRVTLERDLARTTHVGSWELDPAAGTMKWSTELYSMFGVDERRFAPTYERFLDLIHADDREFVELITRQGIERGEAFSVDLRVVRPDGEERVILTNARVEAAPDGSTARLVGVCLDITERKAAEDELEHVHRRQEVILEAAGEGIVGLDRDGCVTFVNSTAAELLGAPQEKLAGRPIHDVVHAGAEHTPDACPVLSALTGGLVLHMEEDVFAGTKEGGFPVQYTASPIVERSEVTGAVLTFNDVTERKRFEAQLRHLADHDPVTGLYNRRRFEEELTEALANGRSGAVLALDLDNFKYVNDTLGHKAGDEVITSVARVITERLDVPHTLARFGGDEFAALLPGAGIETAQSAARAVIDAVRAQDVTVAGQHIQVTASVGVTTFGNRQTDGETLLVEADLAMYDAKGAGRDRFALYTPMTVREAQIEARLAWVGRVRSALEEGRMTLCSQPVVSISTGQVVQHELLLRMREGDQIILPGEFMPSAERFGLMATVDRWVVREAVRLLSELDPALKLEVNVSGETAADEGFTIVLSDALSTAAVDPSRLVIEIEERAALLDLDVTRRFAQEVKHLGCRFALDDFGANFGSFYYLKYLPFDYLKIDGNFVHSLPANRTDQLVVRAVADIARGLGRQTIAEFVGDDDTIALLRQCGVDLAQGYHLGRPTPVDQLLRAEG